ncbi:hypothetical protein [Burkholderia gladioli]|uniref:hypothetical protein n=1 Tax=Burkholderia gladioli TaxID=28095 RepID=UPI00163EA7C9|nr:hypothetical protein [Burkholderia gladioli]
MQDHVLIARVVLHKDDEHIDEHTPDAKEYKTLHALMHESGFRRFVTNEGDNTMYKLPPGEYHISLEAVSGSAARNDAITRAKAAASDATSERRFSVLVTGSNGATFYGLEEISEDPDADASFDSNS